MAKTREIKGRIKAVANIQRITKTMQMIATARFQAALRRATASKPYSQKIGELVAELAGASVSGGASGSGGASASGASGGDASEGLAHPLLRAPSPPVGRELLLVISSNRGLAGSYNSNILRQVAHYLHEHAGKTQVDIEVVGRKAVNYFRFTHTPTSAFHSQFTDKTNYEQVNKLAEHYIEQFTSGKYDAVRVVYTSFVSVARQQAKIATLLPMQPPREKTQTPHGHAGLQPDGAQTQYEFSPDARTLLNQLLPITVKTQLYQWFNEAVVGEQIARMVAMKNATDAAGKMRKTLNRRFNRARQAAITTELSEIIAGAVALE